MASNKNNQQKGSGANEPHESKSIASDAVDVDWMIMSDLSTRISGYPQPQKSTNADSNQPPAKSSPQQIDDDLEDLEWLQSIGLDSPIDRKSAITPEASNQVSNNVENIDWLIVKDLKTRMDDSDIQARAKSHNTSALNTVLQPQQIDSLEDIDLDDDLGLNGLDFLEDSEFSGIDDLGFDTSDEFDAGDLLDDAIDSNDNNSLELDNFLEENFDLDNIDSNSDDNGWDAIAEIDESLTSESFISDENDFIDQDLINSDEIANIPLEESVEEEFLDIAESPDIQDLSDYSDDHLIPEIDNFTNEFAEVQPLESFESNAGDEVWTSPEVSNSDLIDYSSNNVFDNEWEQALSADSKKVSDTDFSIDDDSIWGGESVDTAAAAIENAFGQQEDWAIASSSEDLTSFEYVEQAADNEGFVHDETDWGADLEAEIDSNNQLANQSDGYEDQVLTDSEQYLDPLVSNVDDLDEQHLDPLSSVDDLASEEEFSEEYLDVSLAIDIDDAPNNFDWQPSQSFELQGTSSESFLTNDTNELNNPSFLSEPLQVQAEVKPSDLIANLSNFEEDFNSFKDFDADFAASIDEQISGFGIVEKPIETMLKTKSIADEFDVNSLDRNSSYGLENIIDENFDLADFDEDSLIDAPVIDPNNNIATTLTPVRPSPSQDFLDQDVEEAESFSAPISEPIFDNEEPFNLSDDNFDDEFERAIANELMNEDQAPELGLIEESLANELLNGNAVADFAPVPPIAPPNLPISESIGNSSINNYAIAGLADSSSSDHDFLDEFDLDSVGSDVLSDDFDSGFVSPRITTGLNMPAPPTLPPMPTPPPISIHQPTEPSLHNPPPPPFLPPLPPRRAPAPHPHPPITPPSPTGGKPYGSNTQSSPISRGSSLNDPSFDDFHNNSSGQTGGRKPLSPIDEGWSDLLDADTVLSDVLQPDMGSPSRGISPIDSPDPRRNNAQRRDVAPSRQRKQNKIPDFEDLGLEIHDENNDWSGLLDGSDLSDNITSISTSTQLPTRSRDYRANRGADVTGLSAGASETQEIPRDRRSPSPRFNEPSPSRMSAPNDPMDFNRFTEENYNQYDSSENLPAPAPSKPKITIPSISIESLWQNYLKIPAMGLGAIGVATLLYSLASRPIFDIGLRWGIFKDASGKDFTNADFRGAKLDNVDFSKAILTGAKMQEASMVGANFSEANLDGVNFTKANLNKARLIKASVVWAEFSDAQMNLVDFANADLSRSNFGTAKLDGSNLKGAKIGEQGTEKAAKFNTVTLLAWQIVNEPREGRNLSDQNLSGLNLSFTSLKRANLSNVKLNFADLTGTDLSGANLTSGQLDGANLSGAKLNGINLTDVKFDKNKLPKTDEETICPNSKRGPCKF